MTTIEESVVSTDEGVAQNPERQTISTLDTKDALALVLDHVVLGGQLEGQLLHLDGNGGQLVNAAAARVNVDVQSVDGVGGANDQRSTSVDDGSAARSSTVLATSNVVTVDANLFQTDGPVVLALKGLVLESTSELAGIDGT